MNNIVYFRNGDASCVYYTKDGHYKLTINKCGEMGTHKFNSFHDIEEFVKDCYGFNELMVDELKNKIVIWDK